MKAVLLVSHGSHSSQTREEVLVLVNILRQLVPEHIVDFAFLEINQPTISEGIDSCVSKGADHIIVTLNFLNAGRHVNEDIPKIVQAARQKYPQVKISISQPIGQHPKIPGLFIDLISDV